MPIPAFSGEPLMNSDNHIPAAQDRALILSSNPLICHDLQQILRNAHWQVEECRTLGEFLRLSDERRWEFVVVSETNSPHSAQEVLEKLHPEIEAERTQVVIVSETASYEESMLRVAQGAARYLPWPMLSGKVVEVAERARRQARSSVEGLAASNGDASKTSNGALIGGGSPRMLELSEQVVKVAQAKTLSVFLTGETGTGKEVIARQIHRWSKRPGPFCAINCAAMVETLLESELFGHVKGSFTGAGATKKGLWEEAENGALFLDEITEASPAIQAKLLRVLQEGTMRRVGSNQEVKVTARVIAASNRDLPRAVKEGIFREDLLYRFGEVLHIPPLRERVEDIPLLVSHFCALAGKGTIVTPEAMELLCRYAWPGNVRELQSVVLKFTTFCGKRIFPEDVARYLRLPDSQGSGPADLLLLGIMNSFGPGNWPTLQQMKSRLVVHAYQYFGQEYQAAKLLGIDYRTVSAILKKEGVLPALENEVEGDGTERLF